MDFLAKPLSERIAERQPKAGDDPDKSRETPKARHARLFAETVALSKQPSLRMISEQENSRMIDLATEEEKVDPLQKWFCERLPPGHTKKPKYDAEKIGCSLEKSASAKRAEQSKLLSGITVTRQRQREERFDEYHKDNPDLNHDDEEPEEDEEEEESDDDDVEEIVGNEQNENAEIEENTMETTVEHSPDEETGQPSSRYHQHPEDRDLFSSQFPSSSTQSPTFSQPAPIRRELTTDSFDQLDLHLPDSLADWLEPSQTIPLKSPYEEDSLPADYPVMGHLSSIPIDTAPRNTDMAAGADDELLALCSGAFASASMPVNSAGSIAVEPMKPTSQRVDDPEFSGMLNDQNDSDDEGSNSGENRTKNLARRRSKKIVLSDDDEDDEELKDEDEESPELPPKDRNSRNQDSDGESHRSASHNSLMDEEAEDKTSEIDDDEEDGDGGEEEENEGEVDSEDELAMHKLLSTSQKMGNAGLFDKNRKLRTEFFDDEASLSGSDVGSDDEEDEGPDEYEEELGDREELPSEEKMLDDVRATYMKQLADDDERNLLLYKDHLLPDGDLDGTETNRRFRFRLRDDEAVDTANLLADDGEQLVEEEEEEDPERRKERIAAVKWRLENETAMTESGSTGFDESMTSQSLLSLPVKKHDFGTVCGTVSVKLRRDSLLNQPQGALSTLFNSRDVNSMTCTSAVVTNGSITVKKSSLFTCAASSSSMTIDSTVEMAAAAAAQRPQPVRRKRGNGGGGFRGARRASSNGTMERRGLEAKRKKL